MFIVPVPGDQIVSNGVQYTVLSYAPFRNEPSVLVDGNDGALEHVTLKSIKTVNGTAVRVNTGKVLVSNGRIKRKLQLPQPNDIVNTDISFKVQELKLAGQGDHGKGMLVFGTTEDGSKVSARAAHIQSIVRSDGSMDFDRRVFLTLYKDYLGSLS